MSIASMTRMASEAEAERQRHPRPGAPPVGPRPAAGGPPNPPAVGGSTVTSSSDPQSKAQASLEAIAAYIPSEAIALYLAALGAFQPSSLTSKVFWLVVGLGFVAGLVVLGALDRKTRPPRDKTLIVIGIGLVSFTVYAAAIPGSPFLELHPQATIAAGFIALVMATFLPRIAGLLGVAPKAA
jgi:hypothetical protein